MDTAAAAPTGQDASAVPQVSSPEKVEVQPPANQVPDGPDPEPAGTGLLDESDLPSNDKLDFGQPLVESLDANDRLDPKQPVWLTRDRKSVVMQSMVCQTQAPLEMFACLLGSK
ncbi:MAG: hypothetical protein ACYC6Y_19825 [Thermoguttaceae bacterium]